MKTLLKDINYFKKNNFCVMGIVTVCLNRESHWAACLGKFLSYPASVKAERTAAI